MADANENSWTAVRSSWNGLTDEERHDFAGLDRHRNEVIRSEQSLAAEMTAAE
jgi:hypothetical protein